MLKINPILEEYPNSIIVNNIKYSINTDFRVWLEFFKYVSEEDEQAVEYVIETKILPNVEINESIIQSLLDFFKLAEHTKDKKDETPLEKRKNQINNMLKQNNDSVLDLIVDTDCIIADFIREYNIDLTDKQLKLHWVQFKILVNNLSCNSVVSKRKELRSLESKDVAKEKVIDLKEIQEIYKINNKQKQLTAEERNQLMLELSNLLYEEATTKYEQQSSKN